MLEQFGEAVRELYRALHPRSMVTGTPLNAAPPGPARNAITPATSSGSIRRLIGVGLEDHLFQHLVLAHVVRRRLVGDLRLDERRPDVAGADGGGGDAGLAAFERERLDQAEHAVLGRDVRRLVRRGDERVRGRDGDEAALADSASGVPRVLGEQERARQQDRDDLVPAILGELADGRDVLDAGVRDHEVQPAEPLQRRGDGALVALAGRQVAVVEVEAEHVIAVGAQPLGSRFADAAGGAGDECGGHAARPYPRARSTRRSRRRSQVAPTSAIQPIASTSGAGVSV